jgi:hypothetical protein
MEMTTAPDEMERDRRRLDRIRTGRRADSLLEFLEDTASSVYVEAHVNNTKGARTINPAPVEMTTKAVPAATTVAPTMTSRGWRLNQSAARSMAVKLKASSCWSFRQSEYSSMHFLSQYLM